MLLPPNVNLQIACRTAISQMDQNLVGRKEREPTQTSSHSRKCILIAIHGGTSYTSNPIYYVHLIGHSNTRAIYCLCQLYHLNPRQTGNAGARSRPAKSRWRRAHANCKTIYRRIALAHHHRVHRRHCHRRTRLANIQHPISSIPVHERRSQHSQHSPFSFSWSASSASQQGDIPLLSYPDCSRPRS